MSLILLLYNLFAWFIVANSIRGDPAGICFVPTKLHQSLDLESSVSEPLVSTGSNEYSSIYREFIEPILNSMSNLDIITTSAQYASKGNRKSRNQRIKQYNEMKESVEVYYVDRFNDPMAGSDISHGIWDISFGQLIFKFTKPIQGIPNMIIFNALLPAIGISTTDISKWKIKEKQPITDKEPNQSDKPEKSGETEETEETGPTRRLFAADHEEHIDQVITAPDVDNRHKLDVYIVHNDPNDTTAYAITVQSSNIRKKSNSFTKKWDQYDDYCPEEGGTGFESRGDCIEAQIDIEESITDLSTEPKCRQIVLCRNGAFLFRLKDIDNQKQFGVSAAQLSPHSDKSVVEYKHLVTATKNRDGDKSSCPIPSINFQFKCQVERLSQLSEEVDSFKDIEWKKSVWFGRDKDYEYRVIPPASIKNKNKEDKDPYSCDDNKKANHRIRFQIRQEKSRFFFRTCCIVVAPSRGTGASIDYYWNVEPDEEETNESDEAGESEETRSISTERSKNKNKKSSSITASQVVGLRPDDPTFPNDHVRESIIGYRMGQLGMSRVQAMEKEVTQEEYEATIKSESKVPDPANPDEHLEQNNPSNPSNTGTLYMFNSFIITIGLITIGISSCYMYL